MRSLFFTIFWMTVVIAGANAQAVLQGTIYVSAPAGQGPDQFAGGPFHVALWRVSYAPDKQDANCTDIRLLQPVNAPINVQLVQGGLHYSISGLGSTTGLAVIVSIDNQPDNSPVRVSGSPGVGSSMSKLHTYKSDVKKFLGQHIVFGIYSLGGQDAGTVTADFRVRKTGGPACRNCDVFGDIGSAVGDLLDDASKFVTATINGVVHTFDQTIDGISGLSKCVAADIQGIADAANFFIDQAGRYYYLTIAGLDNFILYGNWPKTRDITDQEYAWANSMIYNGTLPAKYRIKIFNFMHMAGDGHRYFTWPAPVGDFIYVNIGDAFDDPMHFTNSNYNSPGQVFIHELGHAWQCGRYGFGNMVSKYFSAPGGLKQSYDPSCVRNNVNSSFNLEQEATLMDRSYVSLYYPGNRDGYSCDFSIPWVERHVRNGVAFDRGGITASKEMLAVAGPVGGAATGQVFHSNGNPTDGDGYFMVGHNNNSFLYYSNKAKVASVNWGVIRDRFVQANYEFGALGWPVQSETLLPDGVGYFQKFDHGFIYWHPKYGSYVIMNNIFEPWAKGGWEKGKLGYPVSNLVMNADGHGYQQFVGGVIFLDPLPGGKAGEGTTSVRYGNPNVIVREYTKYLSVGVREMINPQPLPPKVAPTKAMIRQ